MSARAATLALVLAAACSEKAIDIQLRPANAPGADTIDLSCMNGVGVTAYDPAYEHPVSDCVEFAPSSSRTLANLRLDGALSMATPEGGLKEIYVKGAAPGMFSCFGPTTFYGGAFYNGGDTLTVFLYPNLSCAHRLPGSGTFRVIDFLALLDTGTCTPAGAGLTAMSGTIHDDPAYGIAFFDQSTPPLALVDGVADVDGMFRQALGSSCLAGGLLNGETVVATSCVYPGFEGACSAAGEYEMGFVTYATLLAARDESLMATWNSAVLGVVWDPALDRPIANATIRVKHGDAAIRYTDYAARAFTDRTAQTTGASGTFTFYSNVPAEIDVEAPGYRTRTIFLGGDGYADDIGAASIITLGH